MGKDDKLNLIIMRDDSRVRRYRVRIAWFKAFFYIQTILIVAAVAGGYFGIRYWGQHLELELVNKTLREQISDQSFQLERLKNIQNILDTSDEEIQSLFSTVAQERKDLPRFINLQDIFSAKDLRKAGVANLQLTKAGDELKVDFKLNNLSEGTLSGSINIYFITQEASVLEALDQDNELRFEIQRFRRVSSLLIIPPGMVFDSIFAIRLVILDNNEEELFIQTYPIATVLTT